MKCVSSLCSCTISDELSILLMDHSSNRGTAFVSTGTGMCYFSPGVCRNKLNVGMEIDRVLYRHSPIH